MRFLTTFQTYDFLDTLVSLMTAFVLGTRAAVGVGLGLLLANRFSEEQRRAIGGTLVDLLSDPQSVTAAQAEFRERTGGGVGGSQWVPPLLPRNFPAPIHYRWPEYVSTPRGEEWWIPQGA